MASSSTGFPTIYSGGVLYRPETHGDAYWALAGKQGIKRPARSLAPRRPIALAGCRSLRDVATLLAAAAPARHFAGRVNRLERGAFVRC